MANEDVALREIDQALNEDRQSAAIRENGPKLLGMAAAIVVGVGGWQFYQGQKASVSSSEALTFKNAIELSAEGESESRAALAAIADDDKSGYAYLARMQEAASFSRNGERLAAIEAYRKLAASSAPKRIQQIALLRAAYLSLNGETGEIASLLGSLPEKNSPNSYFAREILYLAEVKNKNYAAALTGFETLRDDVAAPSGVRDRAKEFAALAAAGNAGVNVAGEVRVEGLLDAVGGVSGTDATGISGPGDIGEFSDGHDGADRHEGHDHGPLTGAEHGDDHNSHSDDGHREEKTGGAESENIGGTTDADPQEATQESE